jgi:hypothetical protein
VYGICADIALRKLTPSEASDRVEEIENPLTRIAGREIVPVFYGHASHLAFEAVPDFQGFTLPYPIGRGPDGRALLIPIRPAFVLLENERLKPVFLVGWGTLYLSDYQKQLISTIIARSLLTQQDFLASDAEVLCLPRIKRTKVRDIRSWSVRSYALLSDAQLTDQFDRYGTALTQVVKRLRGE